MNEQNNDIPEKFYETVDKFLETAKDLEGSLSVDQIHSAFLYASSCYTSEYISDNYKKHGKTTSEVVNETIEIYKDMLENGVKHYNKNKS